MASVSPLFAATAWAAEKDKYNAIFKETTVEGSRGILRALPVDGLIGNPEKYNALNWDESLLSGR